MRFSLGVLLAVSLAGLQFLAVLAVVFSSYVTSERALLNYAKSLFGDAGNRAADHTKDFLSPARNMAELTARMMASQAIPRNDLKALESILFQKLQLAPQIAGAFYGGENGDFVYVMRTNGEEPFRSKIINVNGTNRSVDLIWRGENFDTLNRQATPSDPFDPRTRPWYTRAREQASTIWTDPYIFYTSREPGITVSTPIIDEEGALHGVMGVDIELGDLSGFLSHLKIGDSGRALIVNRSGDIIAHPDFETTKSVGTDGSFRFTNIRDPEDPIARAAFSTVAEKLDLPANGEEFTNFTYDGETYVSAFLPSAADLPLWTIAVYAPENDFIGAIKKNRATNIWIAALVAVVTGAIGIALASLIYVPVKSFATRFAQLSDGEVKSSKPLPRTYKELANAYEALVQQVSARRRTEHEYGRTFDLSSRGMAQIDPETGRFLRVNKKLCDITGYEPDELENMKCSDLIGPNGSEHFMPPPLSSCEDFTSIHELCFVRKDGKTINILFNAILIRDCNGRLLYAVATLDDITKSKAQERQIARLRKDVAYLARDNTMGQMACGLAHELNQPLTAIAQNADAGLLTLEKSGERASELKGILTDIESQSLRAGDIIRALRGFINKNDISRGPCDLDELLGQVKNLMQSELADAGVTIDSSLSSIPLVECSRVQIAQVFINLIRNAVEAIYEAGATERTITVQAKSGGEQVEVSIEDTGPGIAPGINLFERFVTTKVNGMGLGLSICRTMIEANEGRLWYDRNCLRGACFRFTLPLYEA